MPCFKLLSVPHNLKSGGSKVNESFWFKASRIKASAKASASPGTKSPDAIRAISFLRLAPSTTRVWIKVEEDDDFRFRDRSITTCRSAFAATDAL
mmetsp:Transcript_2329/g.5021  ORF Transcript_2329/g.5021 Transcript_2329/m.5021 type:complete len:95 (+) Transcript_2329:216-500(+)